MIAQDFFLNEVHYGDFMPKSFEDFRKKYMRLKRTSGLHNLYVQFTNHSSFDPLARLPNSNPDHNDFVGVYAYPINYVLSNPADIWYGAGARYLRILEDTSKNKLNLRSDITSESYVIKLLMRGFDIKYREAEDLIATSQRIYRHSAGNKFSKIFLTLVQHAVNEGPNGTYKPFLGKERPDYRLRTGQEQTAILRKMGIDAIEDDSRNNKTAIINDREPEQICFLNRYAFKVIEVFSLRPGIALPRKGWVDSGETSPDGTIIQKYRTASPKEQTRLPSNTSIDPSHERIERPLVSILAKMLDDDKIADGPDTTDRGGWSIYWTKKGRTIEIKFSITDSYMNSRRWGEKKHREFKLSEHHTTEIKISTEFGSLSGRWSSAVQFKDITYDLLKQWRERKSNPAPINWTPQSRVKRDAEEKAKREKAIDDSLRREKEKSISRLPVFLESAKWVADHYDMPFDPTNDPNQDYWLVKEMESLSNRRTMHSREKMVDTLDEEIENITYLYGDLPWTVPLRQLYNIIRRAWEDVGSHEKAWYIERGGYLIFDRIKTTILNGVPT